MSILRRLRLLLKPRPEPEKKPKPTRAQNKLNKLIASGLQVGKNFNMREGVVIDPSHCWHIRIGNDVTLAPFVHVLAHDASTKQHLGYTRIGKVSIGDRVFIGASAIILPGVTIGPDVIVGAGSVVNRDVPEATVVAGNPARVICSTEEFIRKKSEEMERVPCFAEEYTLRGNVTPSMKEEMNKMMNEGIGYVD